MENKNNEEIYYEYEKKKNKAVPIVIILVVTIAMASFFFFNKGGFDFLEALKKDDELSIKESEAIIDKNFMTGLRLSSMAHYDEAISYFEELNFNDLSEADQKIVLKTYLNNDNEQKALDLSSDVDVEIVEKYLKNDEMYKLEKLETDSKLIELEVAILNDDYEKITEFKNTTDVKMNARLGNAIANAFYKLGNKEEAVNFTSLMVLDGINMWEYDSKVINEQNQLVHREVNSSTTGFNFVSIYIIIVSLILLSGMFYFIYSNKNNLKYTQKNKKSKNPKVKKEKEIKVIEDEELNNDDEKYSYHYNE